LIADFTTVNEDVFSFFCVPVGRASLYAEDAVLAEQVGELRVGGV